MPTVHKSINYSKRALSYICTRLDPIVDIADLNLSGDIFLFYLLYIHVAIRQ